MLARALVVGGLVAVALLVVRASDPFGQPLTCTLVGADPGVELERDDPAAAPVTVEVCVEDRCAEAVVQHEQAFVALPLPRQDDVELSVTVTAADGAARTTALDGRTRTLSPNGEECGPNVGRVALALDADGRPRLVTTG